MPYIEEKNRKILDSCIAEMILCLKATMIDENNINLFNYEKTSNEDILNICGNLNYVITKICAGIITNPSYSKIALVTGVLENVKQEFYRRLAGPYEDKKILENGDIKEYRVHKPI